MCLWGSGRLLPIQNFARRPEVVSNMVFCNRNDKLLFKRIKKKVLARYKQKRTRGEFAH